MFVGAVVIENFAGHASSLSFCILQYHKSIPTDHMHPVILFLLIEENLPVD